MERPLTGGMRKLSCGLDVPRSARSQTFLNLPSEFERSADRVDVGAIESESAGNFSNDDGGLARSLFVVCDKALRLDGLVEFQIMRPAEADRLVPEFCANLVRAR